MQAGSRVDAGAEAGVRDAGDDQQAAAGEQPEEEAGGGRGRSEEEGREKRKICRSVDPLPPDDQ